MWIDFYALSVKSLYMHLLTIQTFTAMFKGEWISIGLLNLSWTLYHLTENEYLLNFLTYHEHFTT